MLCPFLNQSSMIKLNQLRIGYQLNDCFDKHRKYGRKDRHYIIKYRLNNSFVSSKQRLRVHFRAASMTLKHYDNTSVQYTSSMAVKMTIFRRIFHISIFFCFVFLFLF